MRALAYIIVKGVKNSLLELLRKPAKLVLYLVCLALILPLLLNPFSATTDQSDLMDLIWLKAFYFAFLVFFFGVSVHKGLANGDVIFEMQDVNLLFVSPISPKPILIYGLAKMTKVAFFAGFFILFQGATIRNVFGKGASAVFILFFCFIFTVVLFSIMSLVIYNLTNGNPRRKLVVKVVAVALFVPLVAYAALMWIQTGDLLTAAELTLSSPVFAWTPFAGWGAEAPLAFMTGDAAVGLLFMGVSVLVGGLLVTYILLGNIDYYEDVLVATETAFDRKRAIAEGNANQEAFGGRTKVVKTGVGGAGASALFFKHLRETSRSNSFTSMILVVLGCGAMSFFMRDSNMVSLAILMMLMWMQIFLVGMGRGLKELTTHYIYLMPEPPFSKVLWSNLEPVAEVLVQSVLLFGLTGVIGGDSPLLVLGCIAVYTMFSMMLIGINYLSMRWFGAELGNGILIAIYIFAVIIALLPGLIPAIIVGVTVGGTGGTVVALGILAGWELVVALISFALSKSVLHKCDIQVRVSK